MSALIINLFGAPGAGKSTGAAIIFAALKSSGVNAELITEFAKDKTWEGNQTALAAQDYIFAKQHYRIRRVADQVDVIVTDSPLLLSSFYLGEDKTLGNPFRRLVLHTFGCYDNINFFIHRQKAYNPAGRSQTETQSNEIAKDLYAFLMENHIEFYPVPGTSDGYEAIISIIANKYSKKKGGGVSAVRGSRPQSQGCPTGYDSQQNAARRAAGQQKVPERSRTSQLGARRTGGRG